MRLARVLFSFHGRIARATFWGNLFLAGFAFLVLYVFLKTELGARSTLVLYPFFLWIVAALAARRMRDRGRSPWWLLAVLIPILGPLWLLIDLGFRRGTLGENQYGDDPLDRHSGYLAVDIGHP